MLRKSSTACRLVHHAKDKCAFIKANCPDEEAGLFSYLSLYYCNLEKAQPAAFTILTLWLGLLFTTIGIAASDFFCINLSTIASILGMSQSMAGVTFLAFGNGSPDVFSTFAAMSSNSGSLAIGELIGAAGFITAVVAGSMALVREFKVGKKTFVRDVGFFIVAASFSMVFLADGHLHMWECCVMIGFYLFYVVIVVVWHWYLGQRRKRRERENAARGQYLSVANEEIEVTEEDGDDEDAPTGQRPYRDAEDFGALERGSSPAFAGSSVDDESDEDGSQGMHLATEMASSMRIVRSRGNRRNTITPIRPSLVGALEFRSVLSSLQKARGSNSRPIHLRRYSDDPVASGQQDEPVVTDASLVPDYASTVLIPPGNPIEGGSNQTTPSRVRAVSMNDVIRTKSLDPAAFSVANVPEIGIVAATPTFPQHLDVHGTQSDSTVGLAAIPGSPTMAISPPPSIGGSSSRDPSPAPSHERRKYNSKLAPLEEGYPGARHLRADFFKNYELGMDSSSDISPGSKSPQRPQLQIPSSSRDSSQTRNQSPTQQFPTYVDSPAAMSTRNSITTSLLPNIVLPDSTISPESTTDFHGEYQERPIKWWPYQVLPSPYILLSALFPTLCTWRDKSIWDKFVSVVSAPSIFLLAITLPVVEAEPLEDAEDKSSGNERRSSTMGTRSSTAPLLQADSPSLEAEPEWIRYRRSTSYDSHTRSEPRAFSEQNSAAVAVSTENMHNNPHLPPSPIKQSSVHLDDASSSPPSALRDWNRWLVAVQIFTAPLFVVLIVWANTAEHAINQLIRAVLYSLLGSLIVFAVLVLTTTPSQPPKYRYLLCFLGFVVSIAWISTIANEVVGVLKAFGVILGISDAILGLTIFAVGNSLGDLVADITVARLGYPVMALSACFGGPMLNILLGIGVSGFYMTVKQANEKHDKNPSKKLKYKPFVIEVDGTLLISGVTLLITLVGDTSAKLVHTLAARYAFSTSASNLETVALAEAHTLRFIAEHTSIPVPKVHHAFIHRGKTYILMERIRGETMAKKWPSLSDTSKASIFNQLTQIVKELRSIPSETTAVSNLEGGPIYDCRLPQTSSWGPFISVYDFHLALRNDVTADSLEAQSHSSPGPAAISDNNRVP
ncbi:hypothetical protein B7494_g1168 [Chlorociboria aeruginascens]|nr:hypothetical protein B7494_g1168 [Chlorociboria aeruginascens]